MLSKVISGEIGINLLNSFDNDIIHLSELINKYYVFNNKDLSSFYSFFKEIKGDTDEWTILAYETNINDWNAYRKGAADEYLKTHKIYSAAEIIEGFVNKVSIKEEDIINVFRYDIWVINIK